MQPLADHRAALDRNETTSGALTAACLEAIASGEGARAFIEVYSDGATAAADVADWCRAAMCTVLVCLLEAFTSQIDNLFLPIYYAAALLCVSL